MNRSYILSCVTCLAMGSSAAALAQDLEISDVVVGIGGGQYMVFDENGGFIQNLSNGLGGVSLGSFHDVPNNLFYSVDFTSSSIVIIDGAAPHAIVNTIATGPLGGAGAVSIVFDKAGNFYVGHAFGDMDIKKFSPAGVMLASYDVAVDAFGSSYLDLAADQRTMFYSSGSDRILRYDVVDDLQLPDFSVLGPGPLNQALRLLPPFDGTGGLLVAAGAGLLRLNGSGGPIMGYDTAGQDEWSAVSLDPNGTSFWSGSLNQESFFQFGIQSAAIENAGSVGMGNSFTGMSVVGEITAGINNLPIFDPPSPCGQTLNACVGVPLSYMVSASEIDAGEMATLSVSGTPAGATHSLALPSTGDPVQTTFDWTPSMADIGTTVVTYTASDGLISRKCEVTINVVGLPIAVASPINGAGGNPMCLSSEPAVLGQDWDSTIDTSVRPASTFSLLVIYAQPSSGTFLGGGELLVDLTSSLYLSIQTATAGPSTAFSMAVPADCAAAGVTGTVQGVVFGGGYTLCNAYNLTVGF